MQWVNPSALRLFYAGLPRTRQTDIISNQKVTTNESNNGMFIDGGAVG